MNSFIISFAIIELSTAFRGMRRGLYGVIYGVVTWGLMLLLIPSLASGNAKILNKNESVRTKIANEIDPYVDNIATMAALSGILNTDTGSKEDSDTDNTSDFDFLQQYVQNFVGSEEQLDKYEKYVLGEIDENEYYGLDESALESGNLNFSVTDLKEQNREELKSVLVQYAIYIISIGLSYLIIKFGTVIIGLFIKVFMSKRDKSGVDSLGLLWGIAEGVLYIFVILLAVSMIQDTPVGGYLMKMVISNNAIRYLYEHNIFRNLL